MSYQRYAKYTPNLQGILIKLPIESHDLCIFPPSLQSLSLQKSLLLRFTGNTLKCQTCEKVGYHLTQCVDVTCPFATDRCMTISYDFTIMDRDQPSWQKRSWMKRCSNYTFCEERSYELCDWIMSHNIQSEKGTATISNCKVVCTNQQMQRSKALKVIKVDKPVILTLVSMILLLLYN